jgi:putative ABC transport system ATP-binding protein
LARTAPPSVRESNRRLLAAQELSIERREAERPAFVLQNITMSLAGGELVLLGGRSGCGKSSLMLALARLIPLRSGTLALNGSPAEAYPARIWRGRVVVVPAEPVMVDGTISENLRLPWGFKAGRGRPRPSDEELAQGLANLGLADLNPRGDVRSLSSGQLQRVALLRSLLMRPDFLLLDEPTANLDRASAQKVWKTLARFRKQTGCGMLCATHHRAALSTERGLTLAGGTLKEGNRK